LVHLLGRVGRPQPAATLSLSQVSLIDGTPYYFIQRPRRLNENFLIEITYDIPCPKEATRRRVRESTQPP